MPRELIKFTWVALLFLYSCSSQQLAPPSPEALILLPPSESVAKVLLKQRLTLKSRGKQQQFLVIARFDQDRLKLVVLLPVGQQLLSLDYDGENLVQENLPLVNIPGKEILASMQFALWPESSIKKHYAEKEGWIVEIAPDERILLTVKGALLRIKRQNEELIVDNYLHDYRVIIETLEKTDL